MNIDGVPYRTIWRASDGAVSIIDQTRLPHEFAVTSLTSLDDAVRAIRDMQVRGAPLIGAAAAFGLGLAMAADSSTDALDAAMHALLRTRPTAVNLRWALERVGERLRQCPPDRREAAAFAEAEQLCEEDIRSNHAIGAHGLGLIRAAWESKGETVNILTHCNAGWLATVDWGTALAPVYAANEAGIPVHVWVDETRPRNQGASLTAWELAHQGIAHTVIVDNVGGHLMQHGRVDLVLVGSDRTTACGDVCNKIGTYLKALAARDNDVPFYVALPSSTIDWELDAGRAIPIEERSALEVSRVVGLTPAGERVAVSVTPPESPVANFAFDVTPARLVTGLLTERGVCEASRDGLARLFGEVRR
ncbi:MAG: S-methyl-5-thioribose-1-phosphate isomerase [Betaproteobacteria bacterium]|nr:S-methyl-5-thioribose-1-phosphate isomerase [Betaproteobacteria bacterium]